MEYKAIKKFKLEMVKDETIKYSYDTKTINTPDALSEVVNAIFNLENQSEEIFVLLCLNTKNRVVGAFEVSRGSVNTSLVHPREVFKRALLCNAASIAVAHNHPSGDCNPSKEDVSTTKRLKECGDLIGINLIDHIIIGENDYVSLKAKGDL